MWCRNPLKQLGQLLIRVLDLLLADFCIRKKAPICLGGLWILERTWVLYAVSNLQKYRLVVGWLVSPSGKHAVNVYTKQISLFFGQFAMIAWTIYSVFLHRESLIVQWVLRKSREVLGWILVTPGKKRCSYAMRGIKLLLFIEYIKILPLRETQTNLASNSSILNRM